MTVRVLRHHPCLRKYTREGNDYTIAEIMARVGDQDLARFYLKRVAEPRNRQGGHSESMQRQRLAIWTVLWVSSRRRRR